MDSFDDAFAALINVEQGFSDNPLDPGNWTGGRIGVGSCRGTKYGISASAYPDLDIARLTLDQAKGIAKAKYWDKFQCDQFDPRIGFQVFDAAYNGGHPAQWLQQACGVKPDGDIGPATIAAVKALDPMKVIMRFDAYRLQYMAALDVWPSFGKGWARRIASNLARGAA
jgi:lysozyme family protein